MNNLKLRLTISTFSLISKLRFIMILATGSARLGICSLILKRTAGNSILKPLYRRNFLTEAQQCDEKWDSVLSDALGFEPRDFEAYSITLQQKLNSSQLITPVEIDLLSHKLQDVDDMMSLETFEPMLSSVRRSPLAARLYPGTSHAIVRGYLDMNLANRFVDKLLPFKVDYGVFLDQYTSNLLLNDFVSKGDWKRACRIAEDLMLQETFFDSMTRRACMIAVLEHYRSGGVDDREERWSRQVEADRLKLEDEEEVLEYNHYKPNGWKDDHFDLESPWAIVGKTMKSLGEEEGGRLGDSFVLLGAMLEGKDSTSETLTRLYQFDKVVAAEVVNMVLKKYEDSDDVKKVLQSIKLEEFDCGDALRTLIGADVKEHEERFIEGYGKLLASWVEERNQALQAERRKIRERELRDLAAKQLENLEKQEEVLTYFENELRVELMTHIAEKCSAKAETEKVLDPYERYLQTLHPELVDLKAKTGKTWLPVPCRMTTKAGRQANRQYYLSDYHRVPWWSI